MMFDGLIQPAFIGPGGPEFLLVLLVLIMMFGAKDAPRILRKLNEIFSQIRNTADGFKREVMYGDLHQDSPDNGMSEYDADYDEGCDEDYASEFDEMEDVLNNGVDEAGTGDGLCDEDPAAGGEREDGDDHKT